MTNQVDNYSIEFVVDANFPAINQEQKHVPKSSPAIILLHSGEHDCHVLRQGPSTSQDEEQCHNKTVENSNQLTADDFIVFDQQTISGNGDPLDNVVPSDYAAETVVMTTDVGTCHSDDDADNKSYKNSSLECSSSSHVKALLRQLGKRNIEAKKNHQYYNMSENLEGKNGEIRSCVSTVEHLVSSENDSSVELTLKEIKKRERDRTKKREQRKNPLHRQKEKELSRHRMKNKRKDPEYREKERQRDRERRRLARQTNEELRKRERERDRHKKKLIRGSAKELGFLKEHEALVNTSEPISIENCLTMIDSSRQTYWGSRHLVLSHDSSVIQSGSHVFEEDVDEDCGDLLPSHLDFNDKSTIDPDHG